MKITDGISDSRVRRLIMPARIVWTSLSGVQDAENLLKDDDSVCRLTSENAGSPPAVLLDFGKELHGGVRLDIPLTSTGKPARVRIRFGESVTEAMSEPNQDHTIHDFDTLAPWFGHQEYGNTGFRFVRIDLLEAEASIDLRSVKAVFLFRDLEYLGSFECSDDRLNRIWQTGAYTVHLCMQDYLWDGIKRDRLVWIGDIHPETRVVSTVFGRQPVVEQSLDYVRERTPLPGWMNGISSYSIWWVITHRDWYVYHGDFDYLTGQRDYLLGLTRRLVECVGDDGRETLDGWRFLEWPTARDDAAITEGLQALLVLGLQAAAECCRWLGDQQTATLADAAARKAQKFLQPATRSKQAAALKALAGMGDALNINADILACEPLRGLSTFYGYYILQARALAGDISGSIELILRYWGGMLDIGATTFWEHFELDWLDGAGRIDEIVPEGKTDIHADCGDHCYQGLRHSFCHGWAAGPTAWLTEHVLGVRPESPGFETVTVKPSLGNLEWVKGTVPTPHGLIRVSAEKKADCFDCNVELPDGIRLAAD